MTRPVTWKKPELDKALRSVAEAGLNVSGIEFDEKGFRLKIGADNDGQTAADDALENWRKKNAHQN